MPDQAREPCRLDHAVAQRAGLSRRQAQRLIARGKVRLDGKICPAAAKGWMISPEQQLEIETAPENLVARPDIALHILGEGPSWIAVDKPAGQPVHPLHSEESDTLLNALAARRPQIVGVGEEGLLRSGVVHRLDVDTTGVMIFALNNPMWTLLREAFTQHHIRKTYHALVQGQPASEGTAELHMTIRQHRPARVAVVDPTLAEADSASRQTRLTWKVIEKYKGASLVEIDLDTGFLHQIRAAFAHLGHPLLGDIAYEGPTAIDSLIIERHMLHAAAIELQPELIIQAKSPWPADFQNSVNYLRSLGI
jgi:23S rRNA pseudouridine1911/1915/1917 synthase